jgi:endonuclease III
VETVKRAAPDLPALLDVLEQHHGRPRRPLPKRALDWVLWENAAYLVPDARRAQAYRALEERTGLSADGILALPRGALLELARLGGMHSDGRVAKWIAIAETVQDAFDGDLETALRLPLPKARRALRKFPGVGAPGADKILLFTRTHALPALESNGLRALLRLGLAQESKNYSATYRSAVAVLEPHAERGCAWLIRAFQLLRVHGQTLCKNSAPLCADCPLAAGCPSAD